MSDVAIPAFDKKYVFCGDYLKIKSYSKPYLLGVSRSDECVKSKDNSARNPKRYDNLKRARDKVAEIIYCNLSPYTKFLTLTTADTVLDIKQMDRMLQTFQQAMRRNGYDLKYLYVYERQKKRGEKEGNSGSLHVHMIIFNDEYIDMQILKKCWKHGRVELKILNGLRVKDGKKSEELIKNPASYVCKYITKESVAEWNEKVYRCSKNLKRPIEINNQIWLYNGGGISDEICENLKEHFTQDYICIFENSKVCQYKTDQGTERMFFDITVGKRKEV